MSAPLHGRFLMRLAPAWLLLLALFPAALAGEAAAAPAKGGFVAAPVAFYSPETRLAWGVVGIHYFRLGTARPPARLSHYRFNFTRTQNLQTIVQVDFELYLAGGKFLLGGTGKYSYYPSRFYGIGNRTVEEDREDFTSANWRGQLEPQLRFGDSVYAGLHLEAQSVSMRQTQEGGRLEAGAIPGSAGGAWTGAGVFVKWDSRDNTFSANRGSYGAIFLNRFFRVWGSDYSYTQFAVDARGYWALGRRTVVAAQGVFKSAWGDCPFQAQPMFGGLNLLRGYYEGRYRDRTMLALQAECRLSLWKRFGLCAFAGIGQVQRSIALLELGGFHAAAGAGVRYKFNPKENLVVRFDAGFAGREPAFYLTFAEAF